MAVSQPVYRQRIRSTETLKKMFAAMEPIAASRITRARDRAMKASPYARALTQATSAVAAHAGTEHPLLQEAADGKRAAMLVLTADRGMAGAYTATVLRAAEKTAEELTAQGKEIDLYVVGRRGLGFYTFRKRRVVASWTGESDNPRADLARDIGRTLGRTRRPPRSASTASAARGGMPSWRTRSTRQRRGGRVPRSGAADARR